MLEISDFVLTTAQRDGGLSDDAVPRLFTIRSQSIVRSKMKKLKKRVSGQTA
jgi:hypothetical protein